MRAEEVARDHGAVSAPTTRTEPSSLNGRAVVDAATTPVHVHPASDLLPSRLPAAGYRAGIIGTGFIGEVHARAIRTAGGDLVSVAGIDAPGAREAAADLGALGYAATSQELIDDPDIDVVHICTPNFLHVPLATAALAAGKHVVCEKPLAMDLEGAVALAGLAEEAAAADGRVAVVPFAYRFHPMVREARARVRSGAVGTISLVHGSYLQDWLLRASDDNWRVDPALGGASRAFGDIGSHFCDLLEFTTGQRIVRLVAQTATINAERTGADGRPAAVRTEDAVTLQYETDGGALGSAVISQVSAGRKNRLFLEISGSESTLAFDQEGPETLWEGRRDTSRLLIRNPEALSPEAARYSRLPAGHPQGYQDCFNALVGDTAAAINGQTPDGLPTFADGLRAAHLAEAVARSARTGTWVEVGA
ncbi:Gfo/Idh/MocA family protein [Oerskovia sp. Root918]|uniref:Gfo/Idh/MocA family protein n=1 Tax=Oerskovia sp. Root918 TaxID=1736607 RepID=UPI0009E93CA5|nr:Gfo/Idh/MocA family oxidoreductase [Oerskovia sp. Root918]